MNRFDIFKIASYIVSGSTLIIAQVPLLGYGQPATAHILTIAGTFSLVATMVLNAHKNPTPPKEGTL